MRGSRFALTSYALGLKYVADAERALAAGNSAAAREAYWNARSNLTQSNDRRAPAKRDEVQTAMDQLDGATKVTAPLLAKTAPEEDAVALLGDMVAARMPLRREIEEADAKKGVG